MGAGILPVCLVNNQLRFLFGKERALDSNPGWSDFGGGRDANESYFETALREIGEELTGFLGSQKDVLRLWRERGGFVIDCECEGHDKYRVFLLPVDYTETLVLYFNNNQRFLQKCLPPNVIRDTKVFEKTEIRWWTLPEMRKGVRRFRDFYQKVVRLVLAESGEIRKHLSGNKGKGRLPLTLRRLRSTHPNRSMRKRVSVR